METDTTTEGTNEVFELNLCDMGLTIPVSHLSLEDGIDVPVSGWQQVFDQLGIKTLTDPAGRSAITTLDARRLLNGLRRRDELASEAHGRLAEKVATKHPVSAGGLTRPAEADPTMTAVEVMLAADADKPDPDKRTSPMEEFLLSRLGPPRKVEGKRENR